MNPGDPTVPLRHFAFIVVLAGLAVLVGCRAMLDAPKGYVALKDPAPFDYKAVSARGHVLAASHHANENPDADLAFWAAAIEHQKVVLDGMKLAAREDLRTQNGQDGRLFTFELGEGQGKLTYLVGVFVRRDRITVVEAGGPAEHFASDLPAIRAAIQTLR